MYSTIDLSARRNAQMGILMRKLIPFSEFVKNIDYIIWFIMCHFPEGMDEEEDISLMEIIQENYEIDIELIDSLTNYYEGIFEENDGYVDDPNAMAVPLSDGRTLYIEFHPGDTEFLINDEFIGCTGPEYSIRKLPFEQYMELTRECKLIEKLFVLPMIYINEANIADMIREVSNILSECPIHSNDIERICNCIVVNSLKK